MNKVKLNELVMFADYLDVHVEKRDFRSINEILKNAKNLCAPFVTQLMQIFGVYIENSPLKTNETSVAKSTRQGRLRQSEVQLVINRKIRRFHVVEKEVALLSFRDDSIFIGPFETGVSAYLVKENSNDRNNGFYFPNLSIGNDLSSIRFNPRNLGKCIGACVFCQRAYQLPTDSEKANRKNWTENEILDSIESRYGIAAFREIKHALLATELYGDAETYLQYAEGLIVALKDKGFRGDYTVLAQEIRSPREIAWLGRICNYFDFCYTLECFDNRKALMSKYKSLPHSEVEKLLSYAKLEGFRSVRVNYMLGLDSIDSALSGFQNLADKRLIGSVGLNTYIPYTDRQFEIRNIDAFKLTYHAKIVSMIVQFGINVFRPDLYERSPGLIEAIDDDSYLN